MARARELETASDPERPTVASEVSPRAAVVVAGGWTPRTAVELLVQVDGRETAPLAPLDAAAPSAHTEAREVSAAVSRVAVSVSPKTPPTGALVEPPAVVVMASPKADVTEASGRTPRVVAAVVPKVLVTVESA
jgi:hypothetical protein